MKLIFAGLAHPDTFDLPEDPKNPRPGFVRGVGFDNFPAGISKIYLVLKLEAEPKDYGNHGLHVHYQDAGGRQLGNALDKVFNVAPDRAKFTMLVPYIKLAVPRPGTYSFEVAIDGKHLISVLLPVSLGQPHQIASAGVASTETAIESDDQQDFGEGPWLVTLSFDDRISLAGPLLLTLIPPYNDQEISLLVNAELEYYQEHDNPAPGVEFDAHLVMKGGTESQHVALLKIGDANKQRVIFRHRPYDVTLMKATSSPQSEKTFVCEVFVARGE